MIITQGSLILTPAADAPPLSHPVILWQSVVLRNQVLADTTEQGFPASEVANDATDLYWQAADTSPQSLTFTLDHVGETDCIGIAGGNLGSANIPVSIDRRADTLDPWTELIEPEVPPDDAPAIFRLESGGAEQYRINFDTGAAPPRVAVVYIGKRLTMQRGLRVPGEYTPLRYSPRVDVANGRSQAGSRTGSIVLGEVLEGSSEYLVSRDFWRAEVVPFLDVAKYGTPFFIADRPQSYPRDVGYCWLTSDPRPPEDLASRQVRLRLDYEGIVK